MTRFLSARQIQIAAVSLLILFIISLMLPANSDDIDSNGARVWMLSLWVSTMVPEAILEGGWSGPWLLYIALLGMLNFVVLWTLAKLSLGSEPGRALAIITSIAAVLAWAALIVPFGNIEPLLIGYYVWSFVFTGSAVLTYLRRDPISTMALDD